MIAIPAASNVARAQATGARPGDYWDEGTTYFVSQKSSDEPLALAELINLIDTSEHEDDPSTGGLVDSHREYLYQGGVD